MIKTARNYFALFYFAFFSCQKIDLSSEQKLKSLLKDFDLNFSSIPTECLKNKPQQPRIIGGANTDINMVPYQVRIQLTFSQDDYYISGGGIILDSVHILTAAHLFDNYRNRIDLSSDFAQQNFEITVFSGSTRIDFSDQNTVQKIAIHPFYMNVVNGNDVALLRLSTPLKLSACSSKNAIALATPDLDKKYAGFVKVTALVSGWGVSERSTQVLQSVKLPVVSQEVARLYMGDVISDGVLAAGKLEGGEDSCQGDSGGPLAVRFKDGKNLLIGIVSWGDGCAKKNKVGIYTRVAYYYDWILEKMQEI